MDGAFSWLLVCLLGYGLLIPWLGFYWDDWRPAVWVAHSLGPARLMEYGNCSEPEITTGADTCSSCIIAEREL